MNKEAAVAHNQHDVSRNDLVVRCTLNCEQIAGPQRGKHARSPRLELNSPVASEHLSRKIKLRILAIFQWLRVWHGPPRNYEVCRLNLHCNVVG